MKYKKHNLLIISLGIALISAPAQSADLLSYDFNDANPWPQALADVMPSTPIDINTSIEIGAFGTPDVKKPLTSTGGLMLKADVGEVNLNWSVSYSSGVLAVRNQEHDLSKLKFGLNMAASSDSPVIVQIESLDINKRHSGSLETVLYPKNSDIYQYYDVPLSSFKLIDKRLFVATDPFIQFTFIINAPQWKDNTSHRIRLDDFTYANSDEVLQAKQ